MKNNGWDAFGWGAFFFIVTGLTLGAMVHLGEFKERQDLEQREKRRVR